MKGYMRQRGDGSELREYFGRDPVSGKHPYATRPCVAATRPAARARRDGDRLRSRAVRLHQRDHRQLIETSFEHAAAEFSPKTVKETRGFVDRNVLPAIGAVPLSKLKPATSTVCTADSRPPEQSEMARSTESSRRTSCGCRGARSGRGSGSPATLGTSATRATSRRRSCSDPLTVPDPALPLRSVVSSVPGEGSGAGATEAGRRLTPGGGCAWSRMR